MTDPAAAYSALRAETAGMFGYKLADLSMTQQLQIDLVSLLRLEVDTMQGQVLAGQSVDLGRLVAAHGLLQKMLPERALVAPAPAPPERKGTDARERLRVLIENMQRADEERAAETSRREEAVQAAEAFSAVELAAPPVEPSAATPAPAAPVSPPTPSAPRHQSQGWTDQREPWRGYVSEGGILSPSRGWGRW